MIGYQHPLAHTNNLFVASTNLHVEPHIHIPMRILKIPRHELMRLATD